MSFIHRYTAALHVQDALRTREISSLLCGDLAVSLFAGWHGAPVDRVDFLIEPSCLDTTRCRLIIEGHGVRVQLRPFPSWVSDPHRTRTVPTAGLQLVTPELQIQLDMAEGHTERERCLRSWLARVNIGSMKRRRS